MDWSTLHWPGGAPWWLILLAGAALFEGLRRRIPPLRERLSPARAGTLLALRGSLYLLILFFLSGPTLVERRELVLLPRLLVLVDDSLSMGVRDAPGGRSRWEWAADFLLRGKAEGAKGEKRAEAPALLDRLSRHYDLRLARFDTHLFSLAREELRARKPDGPGSDPLRALRDSAAARGTAAERPAGILLLSDGGDTAGRKWPPSDAPRLPPVVSVGFGSPKNFRDISLHDVRSPRIAFRGKEVRLDVRVSVHGYAGKKLPVALTRGGRVIRTQTIDIREEGRSQRVSFRFTPSEVGSLLLAVETPVQRGELVESNNRVEIPLEVRRNKIRVLTISGAPSWNYRFFRLALKRDPAVDLVSFVFLRTAEDDPGVSTRELSLVPFPLDKLFLEELKNFDIVVFDNFSTQEYFSSYYLERVVEFVRGGGAFLMLGGRNSFGAGGYARSPLQDLLPVRLKPGKDFRLRSGITSRLTPTGMRHPITRLSSDPRFNAKVWKNFPPLRRINLAESWPKGQVLVTAQGEDGASPLIATSRVGEGRILAVLSDDFWRWNFGMVAAKKSNNLYLQFISQMIRWLVDDPASSQVQILPDTEPGPKGVHAVRIQVRDDSYALAEKAKVTVEIRDPYGNIQRAPGVFQRETGEFEVLMRPRGSGNYRVEVFARLGGRSIGHSVRTVYVGGSGGAELADVRRRWDRLASLAKKTGGRFLPAGGDGRGGELADRVLEALRGKVPPKILETRDVRLWSIPWAGFLLILLPCAEWTLRRLWGMA